MQDVKMPKKKRFMPKKSEKKREPGNDKKRVFRVNKKPKFTSLNKGK
jgi:hypothetical protein